MPPAESPYQPVKILAEADAAQLIRIMKIGHPEGNSECSYFTFAQFADELTMRMLDACKAIGLEGSIEGTGAGPYDACIRCYINDIKQYHLTRWQMIQKWLLPFGYYYSPATFTITGVIEPTNTAPKSFSIKRNFNKGRLGEKANMRVGIGSEAMRIVSMAANTLRSSAPRQSGGPFWSFALLLPLIVALLMSGVVYFGWHFVSGEFAGRRSEPNRQVAAAIHAILAFTTTLFFAVGLAPHYVYADPRAAWAYRFASTSKSIVLRSMFLVMGSLFGVLTAVSLILMWTA
jgi:hypothetical protein